MFDIIILEKKGEMEMKKSRKISADIDEQTNQIISNIRLHTYMPISRIIEVAIKSTFGLSTETKKEVISHLNVLAGHYQLMENFNSETDFIRESFHTKYTEVKSLIDTISCYPHHTDSSEQPLKYITMDHGKRYIQYPSDWVVINPEEANSYNLAFVIECTRSSMYNIPHFLFFCDETAREENNFTPEFKEPLFDKICEIYHDFKIIRENQYTVARDSTGMMVLDSKYQIRPVIGMFKIIDSNELKEMQAIDKNYTPVANALVVIKQ